MIGGETAEMPGMYPAGSYDVASFCVGAAERGTLLSLVAPKVGDIAIAFGPQAFIPTASHWFEKLSKFRVSRWM